MRVVKVFQYLNLIAILAFIAAASTFGYLLVTEQPETKTVNYQEYMQDKYAFFGGGQDIAVPMSDYVKDKKFTIWVKPPSDALKMSKTAAEYSFVIALCVAAMSLYAKHRGITEKEIGLKRPMIVTPPVPQE